MKSPSLPLRLEGWGIFFWYAPLLTFLYYSTFSWLVTVDWPKDEYSYCYFIPFIFLYLAYEKKIEFAECFAEPTWKGLYLVGLSTVLFWLGELGGEFYTLYISFWLLVIGICWTHWGWQKLKVVMFPLFFLLTMFPLPNFLNNKVSVSLKLLASQIGVAIIQFFGLSAYREGNIIDLGFTQLQVVEACSGLRFLNTLLVMGLLIAYFSRMHLWKKIVLFLSTIPLAIITNSLRIATVAVLYKFFGASAAEGFFHDFSGWFIFLISLALLLLEVILLQKIFVERHVDVLQPTVARPQQKAPSGREGLSRFNVISSVIIASIVLSYGVEFREEIPIAKSFAYFPNRIGEWTGSKQEMAPAVLDELDLSDYLLADYDDGSLKSINLYVAYYESQRKGESIHSPATCLPGSGWIYKEFGEGEIRLPEIAQPVRMNRALIQKGDVRQLSYYWFPQRGRMLTNAYQLKYYAFLDALMRQRTDGALVRVITPIYETEAFEDADQRLKDFIAQLTPVLADFLPQ